MRSRTKKYPIFRFYSLAAASKAAALLSHKTIIQELIIAEIDESLCSGCHRCEKVCEYKAISINDNEIAQVDELKCKGCGVCISSCPARAIDLKYYRDRQFEAEIKGIGEGNLNMSQKESTKIAN